MPGRQHWGRPGLFSGSFTFRSPCGQCRATGTDYSSEPRFRAAFILAVTGTLLQAGLLILGRPVITSLVNVMFFSALWIPCESDYVLHPPPSPIFGSDNYVLQLYFIVLIFATLTAAWFLTHWWLQKHLNLSKGTLQKTSLAPKIVILTLIRMVLSTAHRMVYPFLATFARGLGVDLTTLSNIMTARPLIGILGPLLASLTDKFGRKAGILAGVGCSRRLPGWFSSLPVSLLSPRQSS